MTKSQTMRGSAGWRGRVLLPVGLAAAVVMGGVAVPTAAFAAVTNNVTVTTTLDAQTANDNTWQSDGIISYVNNSMDNSTNPATPAVLHNVRTDLYLTGIAGLECTMVTVQPGPIPNVCSGTNGNLIVQLEPAGDLATGASHTHITLNVDAQVPATGTTPARALTGTLSVVAKVNQVSALPVGHETYVSTIATAPAVSTQLTTPGAPTFNAAPPAATIYQSYSYTLAPATFLAVDPATGWKVYQKVTTGTPPGVTTYTLLTDTISCGVTPQRCIVLDQLGNGQPALLFNTTTRVISGTATGLNKAIPNPDSYVFVANNGTGGATTIVPAEGDHSVLPVALHDVSMTATIPVLFSDVAPDSQFGPAIYTLAGQWPYSVIEGYGDGTFRPNFTVTRQAFVHFAAQVINNSRPWDPYDPYNNSAYVRTGPCNASFHPSAYSDVPNDSPFCQEIQDLSTLGVINGYTDGTFGPTNIVSRQAISAFLYRVDLVVKGLNANTQDDAQCTGSAPFNDVAVTDQFCGDISWMVDNGIATGYSDGGFHPLASSSRQAAASFLYKLEIFEGLDGIPTP